MKKTFFVLMVLSLMLVGSLSAIAAPQFTIDGLFLMGTSKQESEAPNADVETKDWAIMANAAVEVYPQVVVEGRYLTSWAHKLDDDTELADDEAYKQDLILAGASYRILDEAEMRLYVGGGYAKYDSQIKLDDNNDHRLSAWGIYGKAGLELAVTDQISILGDVAYAHMLNVTTPNDDEADGSVVTGRGSVVYRFNESMGIQAGVAYTTAKAEEDGGSDYSGTFSSTIYGAGVSLSF